MGPELITALITGGLSLLGVIITNVMSNRKIENNLVTAQAVTDEKIDQLRKSVDKHNSFAQKIPVLDNRIQTIEGRVTELGIKVDKIQDQVDQIEIKNNLFLNGK